MPSIKHDEALAVGMELLRTRAPSTVLHTERAGSAVEPLRSVFWLHFPKAASSFSTTVSFHVCGDPPSTGFEEAVARTAEALTIADPAVWPKVAAQLAEASPALAAAAITMVQRCSAAPIKSITTTNSTVANRRSALQSTAAPLSGSSRLQQGWGSSAMHLPLKWDVRKKPPRPLASTGSVVALFREPSQRLLSAHRFMQASPTCCTNDWGIVGWERRHEFDRVSAATFVRMPGISACQTKMLLGATCCDTKKSLRAPDVLRAASYVKNRMAFVGLQSEWETVVCLWHARFGLPVYASELADSRPTTGSSSARYDEAELEGFVDAADEVVYEAASRRFATEVSDHAGSVQACLASVRKRSDSVRKRSDSSSATSKRPPSLNASDNSKTPTSLVLRLGKARDPDALAKELHQELSNVAAGRSRPFSGEAPGDDEPAPSEAKTEPPPGATAKSSSQKWKEKVERRQAVLMRKKVTDVKKKRVQQAMQAKQKKREETEQGEERQPLVEARECGPKEFRGESSTCAACHASCGGCSGSGAQACTSCDGSLTLHNGQCLPTKPRAPAVPRASQPAPCNRVCASVARAVARARATARARSGARAAPAPSRTTPTSSLSGKQNCTDVSDRLDLATATHLFATPDVKVKACFNIEAKGFRGVATCELYYWSCRKPACKTPTRIVCGLNAQGRCRGLAGRRGCDPNEVTAVPR